MNKSDLLALSEATRLQTLRANLQIVSDAGTIFGVRGAENAQKIFRSLLKICHPDANEKSNADSAAEVFIQLKTLWDNYSDAENQILTSFSHNGRTYSNAVFFNGDAIADNYIVEGDDGLRYLIRLLKNEANLDIFANESVILNDLASLEGWEHFKYSVPTSIVAAPFKVGAINSSLSILQFQPEYHDGTPLYTLTQLAAMFENRIDPKHIGWIWNRLLPILEYAHLFEYVHGAVTPDNILVHPQTHSVLLTNWEYTAAYGARLRVVPSSRRSMYPPELEDDNVRHMGNIDYYTAAKSMLLVTGGQKTVLPPPMFAYFRAMTWDTPHIRLHHGGINLQDQWGEILHSTLRWKREFVKMEIPVIEWASFVD